jgi:transposase InsO family protein
MSTPSSNRDRWAQLRFLIVGRLFAEPPEPGDLYNCLLELAKKTWRHPVTGEAIRFSVSTLERWYYQSRKAHDPVRALQNRPSSHHGTFPSLGPAIREQLCTQYQEHAGWTVKLHYDNLVSLNRTTGLAVPSYPTIRRFLKARGMQRVQRPRRQTDGERIAMERLERLEVRSYEVEYVQGLWHLDFHHGSRPVLLKSGEWVKPILFGVLDDRSRLVCHLQWYLDETAEHLVHGLSQAIMKRGLPRALMTDNGAAMVAGETVQGLEDLGILHQRTLPYSAYQNGKQEYLWSRVESRLMAMLEGEDNLTLKTLNLATQAWVEQEYNRTPHSEIKATPLERSLQGPSVSRPSPSAEALADAFRVKVTRRQRRSDGTVSLEGQRFEVPGCYRHLELVHLRYARWDLGHVDLMDPRAGQILCAIRPVDKAANASGQRKRLEPRALAPTARVPAGAAPLLKELLADYAASGLPPAYLPIAEEDPS